MSPRLHSSVPGTHKVYTERFGYFLDWCERGGIKHLDQLTVGANDILLTLAGDSGDPTPQNQKLMSELNCRNQPITLIEHWLMQSMSVIGM